ncbi:MAG TPA: hypothetical protein VJN18_29420 [Polyangiaceae bacterium]|nr:hypothetical protein [Polyangiaceae bacterium]
MKSFAFARALVAASVLGLLLPLACGDSEENPDPDPVPNPNVGGEGGAETSGSGGGSSGSAAMPMLPPGISETPSTAECSSESCDSAEIGIAALGQLFYIDPCCAGQNEDACGLDTQFLASTGASFEETCQPKNQPGDVDEACPSTESASIPFGTFMAPLSPFPGCCRPSGTCGVQVNQVVVMLGAQAASIGNLELGCVDAAPFFPNEDPVPCGGMPIGGAGGSGTGGASTGGASTGGAPAGGGAGVGGAGSGN